jgi:hypothetical protein
MKPNLLSLLLLFMPLMACANSSHKTKNLQPPQMVVAQFPRNFPQDLPAPNNQASVRVGGFSGLQFDGLDQSTGLLRFTTHTDRGPNPEAITLPNGLQARPFAKLNYQPEWIQFEFNPATKSLRFLKRTGLTLRDGSAFSGRPNLEPSSDPTQPGDEVPVDLDHKPLPYDTMGSDLEAITRAPDGTVWMVEEYRPSLLHLNQKGRLIERYVPKGLDPKFGQPELPQHLSSRKLNRGFEAAALDGRELYAFMQSPLPKTTKTHLPVVVFDIEKKVFVKEIAYPLSDKNADKIGDAVRVAPGKFIVIEQNSEIGNKAIHRIYLADFSKTPIRKVLVADLESLGLKGFEKIEGLALVDDFTLAVVNDNDFAMGEKPLTVNPQPTSPEKKSDAVKPQPSTEAVFILLKFSQPLTELK